jgi:copper transport protein
LWVTVRHEQGRAEISLLSRKSGINTAYVRLSDDAGIPIEPMEVTLIAANPAARVEPIRREGEVTASGAWRIDDLPLVPPGKWSLRVDVLVSDFEKLIFETEVELR